MAECMKNEIWKDVPGYDGKYQVSNLGRIRSVWKLKNVYMQGHTRKTVCLHNETIINPVDNGNGYLYITFVRDGKRKNYYIHRLVANAFVDNPHQLPIVNHIDYDKKNNKSENLEWCTQKENILHSIPNMRIRHNVVGVSGFKYISIDKKGLFRVCVPKTKIDKRFKSLEEAIKYRNGVLDEHGIAI